jgi:hypothetical protein
LRDGISFSSKAFNRLSASANTLQSLDFKPTIDEWLIDFAMHFFERLCGTLESVQGSIDLSNDIDRRSRIESLYWSASTLLQVFQPSFSIGVFFLPLSLRTTFKLFWSLDASTSDKRRNRRSDRLVRVVMYVNHEVSFSIQLTVELVPPNTAEYVSSH